MQFDLVMWLQTTYLVTLQEEDVIDLIADLKRDRYGSHWTKHYWHTNTQDSTLDNAQDSTLDNAQDI